MATISTAMSIQDRMSGPLQNIISKIQGVNNGFYTMRSASQNALNSSAIQSAGAGFEQTKNSVKGVADGLNDAANKQSEFNEKVARGQSGANGLMGSIKGMVGAYAGLQGAKAVMNLADNMTSIDARLDLIVDDGGSVDDLRDKIFNSAQEARGAFLDTANMVAKLGVTAGKSFSGNDEILKFTELMNKSFVIGGASIQEQKAGMYQLTQAMASGRLQGDEFRSIIENAPMLAMAIEDYMKNVMKAKGSMKDWSSDGLLTADVIKNALFSVADETNEKFKKMPMTFAQVMTSIQNTVLQTFQPIIQVIGRGAQFIYDNWGIISPIIWGVVGALLAYHSVAVASAVATRGLTIAKTLAVPVYAVLTGATMAQTAAQWGLNASLYACPIVWVVMAVVGLIAIFYAAIGAVNKFAGTSLNATGIIVGAFHTAGAFIKNLLFGVAEVVFGVINLLFNPFMVLANFIGNIFTNTISSVIYLFQGLFDNVLGIIESIASAIDFVFGSHLADSVAGWRVNLKAGADSMVAKYAPNENYKQYMPELNLNVNDYGFNRKDYSDTYKNAYTNYVGESSKDNSLGYDLKSGISDTAANTASMKNSLSTSEEDLKYLRDIAERDTINRFTTAEIKVEMTNNNTINSDRDLDGVVSYLEKKVEETMIASAEGVHI